MNKYSKFILKLSIQICFMLSGLCLFLHIFAPYAVDYMNIVAYRGSLIETIGGVFLVGIICSLLGDLILRKNMGKEVEESKDVKENETNEHKNDRK